MRPFTLSTLLPACLGLAACVSGSTLQYTPIHPLPPQATAGRSADTVAVLTASPERPHVDVALLEAEQEDEHSTDDAGRMIERLRIEAAGRGCDAVVVLRIDTRPAPRKLWFGGETGPFDHLAAELQHVVGTCIAYTDGQPRPRPPTPTEGIACAPAPGHMVSCPGSLVCRDDRCVREQ